MKNKLVIIVVLLLGLAVFFVVYKTKNIAQPVNKPVTENLFPLYPLELSTKYITDEEWPPKIELIPGEFKCLNSVDSIGINARVDEKIINGRTYCVTIKSEGAAGSTYTTYTYDTAGEPGEIVRITTTLRFVQCENYNNPKKSECKQEQAVFSPNITILGI